MTQLAVSLQLEAKGALARTRNEGRTIFYKSAVKPEKVRKPLVKSFLRRIYGDDLRPGIELRSRREFVRRHAPDRR